MQIAIDYEGQEQDLSAQEGTIKQELGPFVLAFHSNTIDPHDQAGIEYQYKSKPVCYLPNSLEPLLERVFVILFLGQYFDDDTKKHADTKHDEDVQRDSFRDYFTDNF